MLSIFSFKEKIKTLKRYLILGIVCRLPGCLSERSTPFFHLLWVDYSGLGRLLWSVAVLTLIFNLYVFVWLLFLFLDNSCSQSIKALKRISSFINDLVELKTPVKGTL